MKKLNGLLAIGGLAIALLLTGCGGGDGSEPRLEQTFVPASQSAALDTAGGSLGLAATDGTVYRLDLPAGALTATTTLTLSTQQPAPGQRFKILLQPAGLLLAHGAVATLTVALPAGQPLPAAGGLRYAGVLMPFTRLADGSLQIALTAFAGVAAPASAVSPLRTGAGDASARKHALAAAASTCGSPPVSSDEQSLTAEDAVEIELYGQCMVATVQALAANQQFAEAVRVASSVSAYLMATGSGDAGGFIDQAATVACVAYRQALDSARGTTVNSIGSLYTLSKPILFWESVMQKLGSVCPGIPLDEYQSVIHAKTDEALAFYRTLAPNLTDTASASYTQAKVEASQSSQTKHEVLALNPGAAVRDAVRVEVGERAQPGLADAMLQGPWDRCRNSRSYDELMVLMDRLDSPDVVKRAAQYCGTRLGVEVLDSQGRLKRTYPGLGGVNAGLNLSSVDLSVANDDVLRLTGPITALQCPAGASGNEELVLRFDGVEIRRFSSAPYLTDVLQVNLGDLRAAARLSASDRGSKNLVLERTGSGCGGYWGAAPQPVLTLTLDFSLLSARFVGTGTLRYRWVGCPAGFVAQDQDFPMMSVVVTRASVNSQTAVMEGAFVVPAATLDITGDLAAQAALSGSVLYGSRGEERLYWRISLTIDGPTATLSVVWDPYLLDGSATCMPMFSGDAVLTRQ